MSQWLRHIPEHVWGFWQAIFGASVNHWYGMAMSIYVGVVAIVFVIGGYRVVHELGKAIDIMFSQQRLDRYNEKAVLNGQPTRQIKWQRVYIQLVRSLGFSIPFGALVLGVLVWWLRESFNLLTYFELVGLLLVCLPLLRVWWIATVVWTERLLARKGLAPANDRRLADKSVAWAVRHYFAWGTQKSTVKRPPYIGLLRPLNPFIKLGQLRWLNGRLAWAVVCGAFFAFIWALSGPIAVFHLTKEFDERHQLLKPEWASSVAMEPTYGGPIIPDTPGDAAAAAGN
jgi:hypothetical protein